MPPKKSSSNKSHEHTQNNPLSQSEQGFESIDGSPKLTIQTIILEDTRDTDNNYECFFRNYLEGIFEQEAKLSKNLTESNTSLSREQTKALFLEIIGLETVYQFLTEQANHIKIPDMLQPGSFYAAIIQRIELVKMKIINIVDILLQQKSVNTHHTLMYHLEKVIYRINCPPYTHLNQYFTILTTFLTFFRKARYETSETFEAWFQNIITDDLYYLDPFQTKTRYQRKSELKEDFDNSVYKRKNQDTLLIPGMLHNIFGMRLYPEIATGLVSMSTANYFAKELLLTIEMLFLLFKSSKNEIAKSPDYKCIKNNLYCYFTAFS